MNSQQFDMSKMDYRAARLRMRKRLFLLCVIPMSLLLVASVWLCSVGYFTAKARSAYGHQDYVAAANYMKWLRYPTPDPFVISFNKATIFTQNKRFSEAEAEYIKALARTPTNKECLVRVNYELSTEASAQEALNQGNFQETIVQLKKALLMIDTSPHCFKNMSSKERISKIKQQAEDGQSNKSDQQTGTSKNTDDKEPTDQQQQKLQKAEQEAAQESQESNLNHSGNTDYNQTKPW